MSEYGNRSKQAATRRRGRLRLLTSVMELFSGILGVAAAVLGLLGVAAVITITIVVSSSGGLPGDGHADIPPDPSGQVEPPDRDGDAVPDAEDNCPDNANPDQEDTNGAGRGDACDEDDDNDGVLDDAPDNCPTDPNPGQEDTDGDGHGDACDVAEDEDDEEDSNADGP
jgi:Thrombospondin type 3 repeat